MNLMFRRIIFSALLTLSIFKSETGLSQEASVKVQIESANMHSRIIYDDGVANYHDNQINLLNKADLRTLGITDLRTTKSILKPLGDFITSDNYIFNSGHITLHGGHIRNGGGMYIFTDYDGNDVGINRRFHFVQYNQNVMIIDENGDVGLGNNILGKNAGLNSAKLQVHNEGVDYKNRHLMLSGSSPGLRFAQGSTYTDAGGIGLATDGGDFVGGSVANDIVIRSNSASLLFGTSSDLRMRITSAGLIGIGNGFTPSEKLHVYGGNVKIEAPTPRLYFNSGGSTSQWNIWHNYNYGNMLGFAYGSSNGSTMMVIDNRGFLGLGVSNGPGYAIGEKLHVKGGNIKVESTNFPNLQLFNGTSTWVVQHSSSYSANQLQFRYDGLTKLRIGGDNGFVGIGTDNLQDRLSVGDGNIRVVGTNTPSAGENKGILKLGSNTTDTGPYTAYSWLQTGINGSGQGSLLLLNPMDGSGAVAINHNPATATYPFPSGYALYVKGNILCEELKVKLRSNWSDYVFDKDYKLRSLDSVEAFINENKHLPEVPSAKEIEKEGINTGEMDAILLKKIEELTLYIIQQGKDIEELKTQNKELKDMLGK